MLQHGLRIAEKYKLRLVTNFNLDPLPLAYYCKINNLKWLWENIPKGIIYYVSSNKNFAQFLQIRRAVILLDEMGLYAPSAQSWTLPAEAFNAVANNRKMCQHIVYAAQYPTQVHSSLHQICSEILYAEGTTIWSEELGNERLLFKDCHLFIFIIFIFLYFFFFFFFIYFFLFFLFLLILIFIFFFNLFRLFLFSINN